MTAIQTLPKLSSTRGLWMKIIGTEIYWPWYTLIGLSVTLATAFVFRKLMRDKIGNSWT
jgi:hypothetical protein